MSLSSQRDLSLDSVPLLVQTTMEKSSIIEAAPGGQTGRPYRRQKWYSLRGKDVSYVSVDDGYDTSSETSSLNEGVVNAHHNVFEAPEAQEIYKFVDGFEGAHRFQPDATWSAEEEKKLIRRVSRRFWSLTHHSIDTNPFTAGLAHCFAGMHHVLRSAARQRQYRPSTIRQHAQYVHRDRSLTSYGLTFLRGSRPDNE